MNFAVPVHHRLELKESEKIDKYLEFAWELKKKRAKEHQGNSEIKCN